ncbi:MAG: hypothetical protein M3Y77_03600 [Actinomycetota bacterium]|nr:hypothetical protein [Actinomycetota bacterium]
MALANEPGRLSCGRDPLEVVDLARLGVLDEHSRSCRYCRAAIAAGEQHLRLADSLRELPVQAPASLLPAVMTTVWAELRPGRNIPLPASHGSAFATERAIAATVQQGLDELPDLLVHLCRLQVSNDAHPHPVEQPLRIEVRAAAAYPTDLTALADSARIHAAGILLSQFGLTPHTIDVFFVDIFQPESWAG